MTSQTVSRKRHLVRVFLGLLLLGLLGWACVAAVSWFVDLINGLDSDVATAFVVASVAVVGSVSSLALSKAYETRAAIHRDSREKKTPVYEEIVHTLLYDVMFAKILGKETPGQQDLMEFFARTTEKLTIWGSDDVLRSYGEWKTKAGLADDPMKSILMFEELLLSIRKDLGHRNKGIGRLAILRLFVTDIDEQSGSAQQGDAADAASPRR